MDPRVRNERFQCDGGGMVILMGCCPIGPLIVSALLLKLARGIDSLFVMLGSSCICFSDENLFDVEDYKHE
jgi:hypothetical protein